MRWVSTSAIGLLGTGLLASAAFGQAPPPVAPVRPVTDTYFGTKVVDNYRWMENLKEPEMQRWLKAQADYTDSVLARIPGRAVFLARLRELQASMHAGVGQVWRLPGDHYFYLKIQAGEPTEKLYERTGLDGAERLIVDPASIPLTPQNRGKGVSVIESAEVSEDGRYVAVGITPGGAERSAELHVVDVATGRETGDVILHDPAGWAAWLPGNRSFVYDHDQDLPPGAPVTEAEQKSRAYLHVLGTDPRNDPAVFGYGVVPSIPIDPAQYGSLQTDPNWKYAVGHVDNGVAPTSAYYVTPVDSLGKSTAAWRQVATFADQVSQVEVHGDDLYVLTVKDASRGKILRTDARHPDLATADVVVPETGAVIASMSSAEDALYVSVRDGGITRMLRVPFGPHPTIEPISTPFQSALPMSIDPNVPGVLLTIHSATRSGYIGAYDPTTKRISDTHLQPVGPYDNPSTITSVEVEVASYDGTLVPLTIVYPKGMKMDGSHPTLLTGYGAYGESTPDFYSVPQLAAFERGAVWATCHVRGGGELGEAWHLAGMKLTKPNTWKDFIACAQYLIAKGYTSPAHLAGEGGSAGGILIGRAIEERPDLFAVAIADVPAADMLRFETTANGVPNIPEFGSTKTEDGFRGLYAMSPYANVKDGMKYPAVLITTGINDPRVAPWEPAKFAARLQAATTSGRPVLLHVDYHAGHGPGSTLEQANEAFADLWSFIFCQTGDPDFQPRKR